MPIHLRSDKVFFTLNLSAFLQLCAIDLGPEDLKIFLSGGPENKSARNRLQFLQIEIAKARR